MKNFVVKNNIGKLFFGISIAILVSAIFVYILAQMTNTNAQTRHHEGLFYEDSVTALSSDEIARRRVAIDDNDTLMLVPVGITAGVRFHTDGVMVLGTGEVSIAGGKSLSPSEDKLQAGDVIRAVGSTPINNISELAAAISANPKRLTLEIERGNENKKVEIIPAKCCTTGNPKIGCWVRDSTQGIGTITYFNPTTNTFSALGHGILDVDTKKLLSVRSGELLEATIVQIKQGKKGTPGELIGEIKEGSIMGAITKNTALGLFGTINPAHPALPSTAFPVASHSQISLGPASILSNIECAGIKSYDIFIESINQDPQAEKSIVIRITDQNLLSRTNGIIQGMSGSPIKQNGQLIGAITHV